MNAFESGKHAVYSRMGLLEKVAAPASALKSFAQRAAKGTMIAGAAGLGTAGLVTVGKDVRDAKRALGDLPSQSFRDYQQYAVPVGYTYGGYDPRYAAE